MAIHFVITMQAQMKMAFCSAFGDCIYVLLVIQNLQQLRQQTAGPSKSRLVDGPLAVVLHLLIPRHDVSSRIGPSLSKSAIRLKLSEPSSFGPCS